MKKLLCLLALLPALSFAQITSGGDDCVNGRNKGLNLPETKGIHFDAGLTAGTTGIGFEFGLKPINSLKIRAGFSYMPRISYDGAYSMSSVSDIKTNEEQEIRMKRLCKRLGEFINSDRIDPLVDMQHSLNFWNAKLLVDVYPFHKKNWHFTVGAYFGPKKLGKAINLQSEAPTMMAVKIYNGIHDQLLDDYKTDISEYPDDVDYIPSFSFLGISFSPLPDQWEEIQKMGRVVVPMGIFNDDYSDPTFAGKPHYLEPDENGVMHATLTSHIVKPYVGIGYDFCFGHQNRWNFGVDAGVLILGKAPHVRDNMGVCLTHDVHGIGGDVGQLIRLVKKFPVYPNLELRLSYTIR